MELQMYIWTYYTEEKGRIFSITVCLSAHDNFSAEVLDITDQPEDNTICVEEPEIVWEGEVPTAEEFAECLRPFGGIPEDLLDILREDREYCLARRRGR
jgi:hypothetical protein